MIVFKQISERSDILGFTTTICSLKNVFASKRMIQYSIVTFCVVTSDVISAKLSNNHRLSWECRAELFVILNTNLSMKMGCQRSNFY